MPESSVKTANKTDDDIDDPLDRMLKKTGCMELHFKVQVKIIYSLLNVDIYFYYTFDFH